MPSTAFNCGHRRLRRTARCIADGCYAAGLRRGFSSGPKTQGEEMNLRAVGIVVVGLTLSGCSDANWANTTASMFGDSDAAPATPAADVAPLPAAPVQDSAAENFCRGAAESAGDQAARIGYDLRIRKEFAEIEYRFAWTV